MIRFATEADLAAIEQVEQTSWPPGMAADRERLSARLAAFPQGQLVEEIDGTITAYAAAQRITLAQLAETPLTFAALTDGGCFRKSHRPQGEIYQLIGVAVLPRERGSGVARALIDRQIEQARQTPGIERIVGVTRPARFYRHADLSIEAYLALRDERGRVVDPVVGFHVRAGARIVSIHPGFRPEDDEARGFGVLIEYPIERL